MTTHRGKAITISDKGLKFRCIHPDCNNYGKKGHVKCNKHLHLCPSCMERDYVDTNPGYCERCWSAFLENVNINKNVKLVVVQEV